MAALYSYSKTGMKRHPTELSVNDRVVLKKHTADNTGFIGGIHPPYVPEQARTDPARLTLP